MKLSDPVKSIKLVSSGYASKLERLGILTAGDFLTHFPRKYLDSSKVVPISDIILDPDDEREYLIAGIITDFKNTYIRGSKTLQRAKLTDQSATISLMWFNQKYLQRALKNAQAYTFLGKIKQRRNDIVFYPKLFEPIIEGREPVHTARIVPEYSLTEGVAKKWFRNRMKSLVDEIEKIEIKDELYDLKLTTLGLHSAIKKIHFPESTKDIEESRKILTLNELTNIQLRLEKERRRRKKYKTPAIEKGIELKPLTAFVDSLPFELTLDQKNVNRAIVKKMLNNEVVNMLVQGDVGSGKTVVAIIASLLMHMAGFQSVVLAPTTILAKQHYDTFQKFLKNIAVKIELVTSVNKKNEEADIFIGTSAVLARKQNLIKNLGLVIVDEQHRFGVAQRGELLEPLEKSLKKEYMPHFINMTATPIPRTIAQIAFGDTDVETINTKPLGRKVIKTYVVPEEKRKDSYSWIEEQIKSGNQVYWICPLIVESERLQVKSAQNTFENLKKIFPKRKIGLLHGKLRTKEKTNVMGDFARGDIDILVSTSVIEVGVDVAAASVMIIESPQRFGLAQLHQIRGRVGRSDKQSYCFLFPTEGLNEDAQKRLQYFAKTNDGAKIAEFDLQTRGPGEVYGTRQSGIPNLKIARLTDLELIKKSKLIAERLYSEGLHCIELFS